jgi:hypothetical protein
LNLGNRRLNKTTIILFERNKLHTSDEEEFRAEAELGVARMGHGPPQKIEN